MDPYKFDSSLTTVIGHLQLPSVFLPSSKFSRRHTFHEGGSGLWRCRELSPGHNRLKCHSREEEAVLSKIKSRLTVSKCSQIKSIWPLANRSNTDVKQNFLSDVNGFLSFYPLFLNDSIQMYFGPEAKNALNWPFY